MKKLFLLGCVILAICSGCLTFRDPINYKSFDFKRTHRPLIALTHSKIKEPDQARELVRNKLVGHHIDIYESGSDKEYLWVPKENYHFAFGLISEEIDNGNLPKEVFQFKPPNE